MQFRHIVKVHAVDTRQELGWQKHRRDYGECINDIIHLNLLDLSQGWNVKADHNGDNQRKTSACGSEQIHRSFLNDQTVTSAQPRTKIKPRLRYRDGTYPTAVFSDEAPPPAHVLGS